MCARGFPYYLCRRLENYGNSLTSGDAPHLFGGWAEYLYLKPRTAVFRVPEGLPDDVAVLTEIFAVTHSLERAARLPSPAGFRPGSSVAVIGVGALGLAHAVKASLMGAGRIIAVDPSRRRLDLAARLAGRRAGRRRRGARPHRRRGRRPRRQRDRLPRLVRAGGRDGARRRPRDRGRRVRRHGGGVVQPGRAVRAQPHHARHRRRGPARLRGHAGAARPAPRERPVRRHGLAPLRRRATRPRRCETALDAERSAKVLITAA